jgi:5-methylcytosine-specific restriction protein A
MADTPRDNKPSWGGQRGTASERGYDYRWVKLRKRILERDYYLCQACLRDGRATPLTVKPYDYAVDHIKAKAQGGTDHPSNLQALCTPCHDAKSLVEAAQGRGATPKTRIQYDVQGFPVWE